MASVSYIAAAKLAGLLQKADAGAGLVVSVMTASSLALGKDPLHPTATIDFSKESRPVPAAQRKNWRDCRRGAWRPQRAFDDKQDISPQRLREKSCSGRSR